MSKATSKSHSPTLSDLGKSFLNSIVLLSSSLILLAVSCLAFLFFYHYNVPATGVQRTVHLQHHTSRNPTANVNLEFSTSQLTTSQPYNVIVELILPNTPSNHDLGNFMVEVDLIGTDSASIVKSARPTIMQYTSPLISTVSTVLGSGPILLGYKEESQRLRVPVLENYQFEAGWLTMPNEARLTIHAPSVRIYQCRLLFETKMEGLPWLLYNFKVPSFVLFTSLFWISSMVAMLITWSVMTFVVLPGANGTPTPSAPTVETSSRIKSEARPVKLESESDDRFSPLGTAFPRVPRGGNRKSPSVAPSSVETGSFFEFDRDDRQRRAESVETEATTMEGDQYIKVEDTKSD